MMAKYLGPLALVGSLGLAPGYAHAEPSRQDAARAARLFDEALKLMSTGQAEAACAKYAESQRLDPQLGTLLHLGECYDKVGRTASAWTSFKEAVEIAAQRNDRRADKIRERLASLEGSLSNVILVVADSEPSALEVRQDGSVVGRAGWGIALPIDPGDHEITATASGAKPREIKVTVPSGGQTVRVELPPIEYLPAAAATADSAPAPAASGPTPPPTDTRPWFTRQRKLAAGVLGGVGVAGIGVGAAFGLMVKPTYDKSEPHCNGDHCDDTGHDYRRSAFDKALVANITIGAGAAALVGGAVLWLTAPKARAEEQTRTTIAVGANAALILVGRRW